MELNMTEILFNGLETALMSIGKEISYIPAEMLLTNHNSFMCALSFTSSLTWTSI